MSTQQQPRIFLAHPVDQQELATLLHGELGKRYLFVQMKPFGVEDAAYETTDVEKTDIWIYLVTPDWAMRNNLITTMRHTNQVTQGTIVVEVGKIIKEDFDLHREGIFPILRVEYKSSDVDHVKDLVREIKKLIAYRAFWSHVFISYAHEDTEFVVYLSQQLRRNGFNVWRDAHFVDPGSELKDAIYDSILCCGVFTVVQTVNAKYSSWVKKEIFHAEKKKKPIVPILREGGIFDGLDSLGHVDLHFSINSLEFENAFKRFVESLRKYIPQSNNEGIESDLETTDSINLYNNPQISSVPAYPTVQPEVEPATHPLRRRFNPLFAALILVAAFLLCGVIFILNLPPPPTPTPTPPAALLTVDVTPTEVPILTATPTPTQQLPTFTLIPTLTGTASEETGTVVTPCSSRTVGNRYELYDGSQPTVYIYQAYDIRRNHTYSERFGINDTNQVEIINEDSEGDRKSPCLYVTCPAPVSTACPKSGWRWFVLVVSGIFADQIEGYVYVEHIRNIGG